VSLHTLLVVTGSRTIAADPRAEAWARGILSDRIFALPDGSVLVTGDAAGPDAIAQEYAGSTLLAVRRAVYALDGWIHYEGERASRWTMEPPRRDRTFPLERNIAMIRDAASRSGYARKLCLALVDPSSRTKGTLHTVTQARRAALPVEVLEWRG
jgi:hypothetical protein